MTRELLDRRLLFVTGKGGVGKTAISAALASLAAQQGKRTLLCEVDAKGDVARCFETGPTGFQPREVQPGLYLMTLTTEESLKEYLSLHLRVPLLARLGPLARSLDFVANAAPGVREILTVGKVTWEVRQDHFDLVVVDASASGHVIAQLGAPEAINELVHVGLVREQTGWMQRILHDPDQTGVVVVTTAEEMPVVETLELVERLAGRTKVELAAVVANRVLPELFGHREEEIFDALREPEPVAALAVAIRALDQSGPTVVSGSSVEAVLSAARLAVTLRRSRAAHLAILRSGLGPEVPLLYLPELFTRSHGARATAMIAEALSAELGF